MAKQGSILIVDDNKAILSAVKLLADKHFEKVLTLSSPNLLVSLMRTERPDVVLLDMNFNAGINTGNEGIYWLQQILDRYPATKVVLFTAYADIDLAVKAMKMGAVDFVVKPWDNDKMIASLLNAYRLATRRNDNRKGASKAPAAAPMLWGGSEAMARIRQIVDKVAVTDANILITGENGTGKDILAREIHRLSLRRNEPFVDVNVGAIPDTLFESELFGHVKGAFTDAHSDHAGKFETASGGTLFLDEIGNLPQHLQAKLLTALQNRNIMPLGGNAPRAVDIRLISATNRDIQAMAAEGAFRQDLLYRINTIHIELPPLRRRKEDIMPLAEMFLARYAAKYGKEGLAFAPATADALTSRRWVGNVRELQHAVEKAVIMSDGGTILPDAFPPSGAESAAADAGANAADTADTTLEDMERRMIRQAIAAHNGNLTLVARQLGITRQTLYNKIKRYGL